MNWLQSSDINCATRHTLPECADSEYVAELADYLRDIGWPEAAVIEVECRLSDELGRLREDAP